MTLPATEGFAGGAAALSGSWTQQKTSGTVNRDGSGLGSISGAVDGYAFWNADPFTTDHYAQVTIISGLSAANWCYCTCGNSTDTGDAAFDGMEFYTNGLTGSTNCAIAKNLNGTLTDNLLTFAVAFASGDTMRLEKRRNRYHAWRLPSGSAIWTQLGIYEDPAQSFVVGSPGVGGFGASIRFDNWEGGNLPPVTGPPRGSTSSYMGSRMGLP